MRRRDFIVGSACLFATAAAAALRPRNHVELIGSAKLEAITPRNFGNWREVHGGQVVQPRTEGTLAAELYSQILGRAYQNDAGDYVMLALAYGDTQSDVLQLHRPEACYPAFGFAISRSSLGNLDVGAAKVPTRSLVASAQDRIENVTYWTRVGEYLPRSRSEQQEDKLKTAFAGIIPDGILVRASSFGEETERSMDLNRQFLGALLVAIDPKHRPVFVGTRLANLIEGNPAASS